MSNRYDEMMINSLNKYIEEKSKELNVEYTLSFSMSNNQYICKIKNCDMAGEFSNYVAYAIKSHAPKCAIRFEFPNIL